jgi:hypothetical protein
MYPARGVDNLRTGIVRPARRRVDAPCRAAAAGTRVLLLLRLLLRRRLLLWVAAAAAAAATLRAVSLLLLLLLWLLLLRRRRLCLRRRQLYLLVLVFYHPNVLVFYHPNVLVLVLFKLFLLLSGFPCDWDVLVRLLQSAVAMCLARCFIRLLHHRMLLVNALRSGGHSSKRSVARGGDGSCCARLRAVVLGPLPCVIRRAVHLDIRIRNAAFSANISYRVVKLLRHLVDVLHVSLLRTAFDCSAALAAETTGRGSGGVFGATLQAGLQRADIIAKWGAQDRLAKAISPCSEACHRHRRRRL